MVRLWTSLMAFLAVICVSNGSFPHPISIGSENMKLSIPITNNGQQDYYEWPQSLSRRLEDTATYSSFEYDLSEFSLRFDRCQDVKTYSDDGEEGQMNPYPFAVRHFVLFRLCPTDSCSSCDYTAHGRYLMPAEDYLQATLQEQAKQFQSMCDSCEEECDDDGGNCSGCGKLCYVHNNLAANGYVDAMNYLDCQRLQNMNDHNNNNNANVDNAANDQFPVDLYIGPRCSNNGEKIGIGLFYDQYCRKPFTETTPEEILGYNISYSVLSDTYTAGGSTCLSCKEYVEDGDENDQQDVDDVNEMCEAVYQQAAKCESMYGIDGFVQMNREGGTYGNQVENEFTVCEYIESLMLDSYTESGEINLKGEQLIIYRGVTPLQWTSFWLVTFSIGALLIVAFFMQRKIENSYPMLDLSCQGDSHVT